MLFLWVLLPHLFLSCLLCGFTFYCVQTSLSSGPGLLSITGAGSGLIISRGMIYLRKITNKANSDIEVILLKKVITCYYNVDVCGKMT